MRFLSRTPVRILTALLSLLFLTALGGALLGVFFCYDNHFHLDRESAEHYALSPLLHDQANIALRNTQYGDNFSLDPDFRCRILQNGTVIRDTITGEKMRFITADRRYEEYQVDDAESHFEIVYGAVEAVTDGEIARQIRLTDRIYDLRGLFPAAAAASGIGALVFLTLFALGAAPQNTSPLPLRVRIPVDAALILIIALQVFCGIAAVVITDGILYEMAYLSALLPLLVLLFAVGALLLTALTAAELRAGTFFSCMLCVQLARWIGRGIRKIAKAVLNFFRKIPVVPKTVAAAALWIAANIILGVLTQDIGMLVVLTAQALYFGIVAVSLAFQIRRLREGTRRLAQGDLEHKIATGALTDVFREQANDLNRIGDGLNAAVNERMKSERMKTELITNVSHDLKTPLTSIVNYVDLLEKEGSCSETGKQYLQVISKQAARLKKLTEDVVEASKTAAGAVEIEFSPCDLKTLLEQTLAEYEDKTADAGLIPVVDVPDCPVTVLADGRRLWRVLDNLMNNVCKYALTGTRVYLSLQTAGNSAVMVFRNISREPLNIHPEELTERFVRGDAARTGSGSGLGLSIASGLTELQHGTFHIDIDGDLFKVTVTFPLYNESGGPHYVGSDQSM